MRRSPDAFSNWMCCSSPAAGVRESHGYGLCILRIGYLVPRMLFALVSVVWRFFESRDVRTVPWSPLGVSIFPPLILAQIYLPACILLLFVIGGGVLFLIMTLGYLKQAGAAWHVLTGYAFVWPNLMKPVSVFVDGYCLGVLSAYTIAYAYWTFLRSDVLTRDPMKSYTGILELPDKKQGAGPGWCSLHGLRENATRAAVDVVVDMTSAARLVIAWHEDWPQGFLGVVLVTYNGASGFATVSAFVAFAKGIGIPTVRASLIHLKLYSLERAIGQLESQITATAVDVEAEEWHDHDRLHSSIEESLGWYLNDEFEIFQPVRERASKAVAINDNNIMYTMNMYILK